MSCSFPLTDASLRPIVENADSAKVLSQLLMQSEEPIFPDGWLMRADRVHVAVGLGRVTACVAGRYELLNGEEELPHSTTITLGLEPLGGLFAKATCQVEYEPKVLDCIHNLRFEAPCTSSPPDSAAPWAWVMQESFVTVAGERVKMAYQEADIVDLHEEAKKKGAKVGITSSNAGKMCFTLMHCPAVPGKPVRAHFVFTTKVLIARLEDGRGLVVFEADIQGSGKEPWKTQLRLAGPVALPGEFPVATSLLLTEPRSLPVIWATEETITKTGKAAVTVYAPMVVTSKPEAPEAFYSAHRFLYQRPNGETADHWLVRVTVPPMASLGRLCCGKAVLLVSIDHSGSTMLRHPNGQSTLDFNKDFTMRLVEQAQREARELGCELIIGVLAFDDSAELLLFKSAEDPELRPALEDCLARLRPEGGTSFAAAAQGWLDFMEQGPDLLEGARPAAELHFIITDGRDPGSSLPVWEECEVTLRQCVVVVTTVYGDPLSAARFAQYAPDGSQILVAKQPIALKVPASLGLGARKPTLHVNIHDRRSVGHPEVTGTFLFSARFDGVGRPISYGPPVEREGQKAIFAWRTDVPEGGQLYALTDQSTIELERAGCLPLTITLTGAEDLEVVKEFLTLPCGLAHAANRKYQTRLRQRLSIQNQLPAGSATRELSMVELDPETAALARDVPIPTGSGAKLQAPKVKAHEEQVLLELLGRAKPEPLPLRRIGALRGRRAVRGGDASDEEGVAKPLKRKKDKSSSEIGATREEVWKEYLSPYTALIPCLCALPEKLARARKDLQSIRACEERAVNAGLPGLAKLLGDLGRGSERVIDVYQQRYGLLSSYLFVGEEASLPTLCKTPSQEFSGIDYSPEQPLMMNVQRIAVRFSLPANFMSITEQEADALLEEQASARAGAVAVLQATGCDEDPSALVFKTLAGREVGRIRVNWGITFAKELLEEVSAEARRVLPGDWQSVSIVKSDGSLLDQGQIMPLMPEEFHCFAEECPSQARGISPPFFGPRASVA